MKKLVLVLIALVWLQGVAQAQVLLKQSTGRNIAVLMVDSSDHNTGKTGLTLTITASKDGGAFASITPTVTELANGWYSLALTTTHTNTLGALALHITGTNADAADVSAQVVTDLPGSSVSSVTGNVAGSVASVTGNVGGNVTGSVGSVVAGVTASTVSDKTGYSLSATGADATMPTGTVASDAGNSTTQAKISSVSGYTDSTDNYWKDSLILFTGGSCNVAGQVAKVTTFTTATRIVTWTPAKTATPTTSCSFLFVNR